MKNSDKIRANNELLKTDIQLSKYILIREYSSNKIRDTKLLSEHHLSKFDRSVVVNSKLVFLVHFIQLGFFLVFLSKSHSSS